MESNSEVPFVVIVVLLVVVVVCLEMLGKMGITSGNVLREVIYCVEYSI